jgi:antitoxin (DNA-binding transcriptional repressor) of toxin-antitoxin stability system
MSIGAPVARLAPIEAARNRPSAPIQTALAPTSPNLLRHELLMTLQPVPESTIREIVDDIFLPLVSRDCASA